MVVVLAAWPPNFKSVMFVIAPVGTFSCVLTLNGPDLKPFPHCRCVLGIQEMFELLAWSAHSRRHGQIKGDLCYVLGRWRQRSGDQACVYLCASMRRKLLLITSSRMPK